MGKIIYFPQLTRTEKKTKIAPSFSTKSSEKYTPITSIKSILQCDNGDDSKNNALLLFKSESLKDQLCVGPWEFSCPKCKSKTKFDCSNMIFKSLDFYCASCGSFFKVINPVFSNK
jgi:Zn finger protein HypA/HybF involved in hydrogenase expression